MRPVFTPKATIQNRTDLGNALLKRALQGQENVSSLSPYANLAQGLAGGFLRGSANRFTRDNQALRNRTLDEIRDAPDGASMARILINSADPSQREFGMLQMIKEQREAARKSEVDRAYDLKERQAQAEIDAMKRRQDAAYKPYMALQETLAGTGQEDFFGMSPHRFSPTEKGKLSLAIANRNSAEINRIAVQIRSRLAEEDRQKATREKIEKHRADIRQQQAQPTTAQTRSRRSVPDAGGVWDRMPWKELGNVRPFGRD